MALLLDPVRSSEKPPSPTSRRSPPSCRMRSAKRSPPTSAGCAMRRWSAAGCAVRSTPRHGQDAPALRLPGGAHDRRGLRTRRPPRPGSSGAIRGWTTRRRPPSSAGPALPTTCSASSPPRGRSPERATERGAPTWPPTPPDARKRRGQAVPLLDRPIRSRALRSPKAVWRLGHAAAPLAYVPRELCSWNHRFDDPRREYRTLYSADLPDHVPARGAGRSAAQRHGPGRVRPASSATRRRSRPARSRRHGGSATRSPPRPSPSTAARSSISTISRPANGSPGSTLGSSPRTACNTWTSARSEAGAGP